MAFDQNSMPKDLRPLNIVRNVIEDPRTNTVTSTGRPLEGFYASPPTHVGGSPGSVPALYYPATVADSGYIPVGFSNAVTGVAGWVQHVVPSQPQTGVVGAAVIDSSSGYSNSPMGTRFGSRASDQASEESGNDSVSGRKIKFLCSFGGKILPRLSDGALRYVGGQTRIISVRRDATFDEFFQKMVDTCAPNVVIKYQLPDEDLDALVTVSCADDLENMMDEYQRLVERSSDGSAKLRIFLFSPSELETAGLIHIGDMQDSGQRYVEAVNGIMDGFSGSVRIARKESIESTVSAQNSDTSGIEGADSVGNGLGDGTSLPSTGGYSPSGTSAAVSDMTQKIVHGDPNPFPLFDTSAPLGLPMINAGPAAALGAIHEQQGERSVPVIFPQALPTANYPVSSPGTSPYAGPREETMNHVNYVRMPSQICYPAPVLGSVFTQQPMPAAVSPQPQQFSPATAPQQFNPAAAPQHYSPAVRMTMNPVFMSMKPNAVPTFFQPRQVHMEHYPAEKMVVQRVVQLPAEQGYNPHQAQAPVTVHGCVYNQIPYPNQNASNVPQQIPFHEKITRFEDCQMCQKALPHAHSDTVAQDQKESSSSTLSDMRSIYHSVHFDDQGRPMIKPAVAENNIEQLTGERRPRLVSDEDPGAGNIPTRAIGVLQKIEPQYADKILPQKVENHDLSKMTLPQGVGMPTAVQLPYGVFSANSPQPCQANAFHNPVLQTQFQPARDNIASNNDFAPVVVPPQIKDYALRESPKEYSIKVSGGNPADDSTSSALDQLIQIDGRLENLRIPSEVLHSHTNELNKFAGDMRKDDLENRPNQINSHYFPTTEPYEVMDTPSLGNPNLYPYPVTGMEPLPPNDKTTNSLFSCVEPALMAERTVPKSEAKDNIIWSQSRISGDSESFAHDGPSLSPSYRVGDISDSSTSLFANQDHWNMNSDTHYPPPRPSKIQIRRENAGLRDHIDSHLPCGGDVGLVNCTEAQLDTPSDDGAFGQDYSASNKGSAEEQIQQELQAVAEGVVASVLHSSGPSNPDIHVHAKIASPTISQQNGDVRSPRVEMQLRDKHEEVETKFPEQTNFGFPVSGMGRLQIIKNSDLEELRELGSGTFGTVFHGKWRGTDVAIKRINDRCFVGKPSEQDRMRDDFWNEAIKLADLHHPNVVAFYGVVLDGPDGSVATVTEYMVNGSLRNALQKSERILDKRKRLLIAMDVAFGMEYLHGKNIVHFDLKSDNLLVNLRDPHRPICKVGDLGLSKVKCHTLISGGVRGTLPWMAPELLNGSSSLVSEKVDVFSYGIVMWELLTGEEPYADLHYGAIIGGIVSNTLRPPVPEHCEADWRSLMERCWSSEPSERPTFTQIADDLRIIAAKFPTKAQLQQQQLQTNPQVKN